MREGVAIARGESIKHVVRAENVLLALQPVGRPASGIAEIEEQG
jgi:hypothetical protein